VASVSGAGATPTRISSAWARRGRQLLYCPS
jgi:hypothetical protein